MFTIKAEKVEGGKREKASEIKSITILEKDGSETVINITEDLHFIFGFTKVGKEGGVDLPMELMIHGNADVIGEIFFQTGNAHPDLIRYCVKRSTEKTAHKIVEEIKKSGVDPIAEALKKMPTPEAKGGWN